MSLMNEDICISLLCCIISLIKFYGINLALFSADDHDNNFFELYEKSWLKTQAKSTQVLQLTKASDFLWILAFYL